MLDKLLPGEARKSVTRRFGKRKVYLYFKRKYLGALILHICNCKQNKKGLRRLLCIIDIYSKYMWFDPLKKKQFITITDAFKEMIDESNRKPNKIWQNKVENLTTN